MKKEVEKYRTSFGVYQSKPGDNFGFFQIPALKGTYRLKVICAPMDSDWQHVSVSLPNRCPSWDEMCKIKDLFWPDDQTVIQFHPKKSKYKNLHPHCLHLWRKNGTDYELPPDIYV